MAPAIDDGSKVRARAEVARGLVEAPAGRDYDPASPPAGGRRARLPPREDVTVAPSYRTLSDNASANTRLPRAFSKVDTRLRRRQTDGTKCREHHREFDLFIYLFWFIRTLCNSKVTLMPINQSDAPPKATAGLPG